MSGEIGIQWLKKRKHVLRLHLQQFFDGDMVTVYQIHFITACLIDRTAAMVQAYTNIRKLAFEMSLSVHSSLLVELSRTSTNAVNRRLVAGKS